MSSPSQKSLIAAKVNASLHIFTHSVRGTLLTCFNPHLLLLLKGLKLGVSCHDIQFQIYHLQRLQSVSEWAKFLWLCSPCFSLRYAEWWRMDRKLLSIFSILLYSSEGGKKATLLPVAPQWRVHLPQRCNSGHLHSALILQHCNLQRRSTWFPDISIAFFIGISSW